MHKYKYTYTHTCRHTGIIHAYRHRPTYIQKYTRRHSNIHADMHKYTHIRTNMHADIMLACTRACKYNKTSIAP